MRECIQRRRHPVVWLSAATLGGDAPFRGVGNLSGIWVMVMPLKVLGCKVSREAMVMPWAGPARLRKPGGPLLPVRSYAAGAGLMRC